MGDGVNIAARLEGIAKPGAICLSEQAYLAGEGAARHRGQRSRRDPTQEYRGAGSRLFARKSGCSTRRSRQRRSSRIAETAGGPACLPDKLSIAVLPFQNMSGDPGAGIFRRRHLRRHHHRAVEAVAAFRHRAQFVASPSRAENIDVRRGRQANSACAMFWKAASASPATRVRDYRAAHRRDDRRPSVGRAVRPGPDRHLRGAGRRDETDRRRARAQSQRRATGNGS